MKSNLMLVLVIAAALLLTGCAQQEEKPALQTTVKYAKNFQLEYHDGYKILKVKQGNEWVTYVLYRDKKPDVEGIPVKIPVKRLVVMSSTHIAQLEAINATDSIVGFMWGGRYSIYFEDVKRALEDGRIVDVGSSRAPDYEKILELKPDLVVIYVTPYNEEVKKKLDELGIPYVIDSEWLENDPLGRAEWVKFFAALMDKEEQADRYFDRVEENVLSVKKAVEGLNSPKLLWCSIYKGKVYVPKGESYVARMAEYANADYLFKDVSGTGSATVTLEELLLRGSEADLMVYSSYRVKSIDDLLGVDSRLSEIKAVKSENVYRISDDYWQLGLLYTDVVVKDLAAIAHPEKFPDYEPRFFVKLE
ncbi:ABC transporter substrate-binding protein [Geoglobus ahangari]